MKEYRKILVKYYLTLLYMALTFAVMCAGFALYFEDAPRWQQLVWVLISGFGGFAFWLYRLYKVVSTKEFQAYENAVNRKKCENAVKIKKNWKKGLVIWGTILAVHIVYFIWFMAIFGDSYVQNMAEFILGCIAIAAMLHTVFYIIALCWYFKNYRKK